MVSVIIPVHDSEQFLAACLQSVVLQSYRNLQIIVVDDGSTDSSPLIVHRFAAADCRIRAVKTPGNGPQGVSVARNVGLRLASGKYFCFIDSDDVLHPEGIATLVTLLVSMPDADMALSSHAFFSDGETAAMSAAGNACSISGKEAALHMLHQTGQRPLHHSPWGKLFRSSLKKNLSFPEGYIYEDLAAIPPLVASLALVAVTDAPLYGYRVRSDSLMSAFTPARMQVIPVALQLRRQFGCDKALRRAAEDRLFAAAFNVFLLTLQRGEPYENARRHCRRIIKLLRRRVLLSSSTRRKNRLGSIIAFLPGLNGLEAVLSLFPTLFKHIHLRC